MPPLTLDALHLWWLPLPLPSAHLDRLAGCLAPDEEQRASAYSLPAVRHCYVACRSVLRNLLARYLETDPDKIEFAYSDHGKPRLAGRTAETGVEFNVSHTDGLAVVGIGRRRPLGVDIERLRDLSDMDGLIRRYFAPAEQEALGGRTASALRRSFFEIWTRKEAVMKALGVGLSLAPEKITVTVGSTSRPQLIALRGRSVPPGEWFLHSTDPASDYVASVAVPGGEARVQQYWWRA